MQLILERTPKKEDEQLLLDSFDILKTLGKQNLLQGQETKERVFMYLCVQIRSLFTSVKIKAL